MFIRSLTSSLLVCGLFCSQSVTAQRKTYIVQLASGNGGATGGLVRRQNLQAELAIAPATVLYNYDTVMDGFAAKLTDEQASNLKTHPDVVSVVEDTVLQLHTTHTPSFLGIAENNGILGQRDVEYAGMPLGKREVNAAEANIIVGVLDTGVWPENPSYSDHGLPAIPAHWKGNCDEGERWTKANCNKKLIGAAYFYKGLIAAEIQQNATFNVSSILKSARDDEGHGTHTSTTIAGSRTANVSLFGQAAGNARGMAPDARLAIYKVCWADGCVSSDILAGIERAIADGVNVISASLGGGEDFGGNDIISRATFAAARKGILSTFSAGNSGPDAVTVSNSAPWILNVAASTLDREFPASVSLGNGVTSTGQTLYSNGSVSDIEPLSGNTVLPLILGSAAAVPHGNVTAAQLCKPDTLDPARVAGKIVVCTRGDNGRVNKGAVVKKAGGRGMVLVNNAESGEGLVADAHVLPAVALGVKAGAPVLEYAKSSSATASMQFGGTKLGVPAPQMASFSSRGPSQAIPQILRPDITGPGVSIIAGWTRETSPSGEKDDTRRVDYNVISGTSMSCPHLSGIATHIMARRPGWSPAAVRSAIMTTAYTHSKGTSTPIIDTATSTAATPFAYGNGHVDPVAALNPGLIYNITTLEYQEFVCSVNNTDAFMQLVTGTHFACDKHKVYSPYDLNYPSFSAVYDTHSTTGTYTATFHRTLTSVGGAGTYKASLTFGHEYTNVVVKPEQLTFKAVGDTQTFEVVVTMKAPPSKGVVTDHGRLVWSDGTHTVGSSLAFTWADME
ncbi:related to Subtilisin-like protease [Rhynchosporium agropyri]|uniref:Related to Subtilisin-like protease n=1 Tax=Rhynchosporium agropyri TaxID=914238 RepID=A0A1E1LJF6_9HELO|nr:related to Subtilisin-like protease [Rhynchosporium agropyri]